MNEKIRLKNGTEYPLVVNGVQLFDDKLTLKLQTDATLENLTANFSSANAEQIQVINGDGTTLSMYDGFTVLGNPKTIDNHYPISPASYDDNGELESEAEYGNVITLILSQPGLLQQVEQNRADIDFLSVMTGNEL